MVARSNRNEMGKTAAIRLVTIVIVSLFMGAMAEIAGRGNIWGIGAIIAVIVIGIVAGTMQRRGRAAYVRRSYVRR